MKSISGPINVYLFSARGKALGLVAADDLVMVAYTGWWVASTPYLLRLFCGDQEVADVPEKLAGSDLGVKVAQLRKRLSGQPDPES